MIMEESHTFLSEDLIVEIILRLPRKYLCVKFILQLRCVCKSWYRIIATNSLVNSAIISNPENNRFLLCTHRLYYTLQELKEDDQEELLLTDSDTTLPEKYCYTPKSFGKNKWFDIQVYGICNGLLCVSDYSLDDRSVLFLWNPVIRKAKEISMILHGEDHKPDTDDLCFGYFDDDYKVIKIAPVGGKYRVEVYSLRTDAWKVTYCDSNYAAFGRLHSRSCNKFVGGVAYFVRYICGIVCFDLHHERIIEVQFPDDFPKYNLFSVEPWGESISLIGIVNGHFTKWVLRNCAATNTSTWEKVDVRLQTRFCWRRLGLGLGFTKHGKYLIRGEHGSRSIYLLDFGDFGMSRLRAGKFELRTQSMWAIDSLVGNLVLLDEKTLYPYVEPKPCSTTSRTKCILYKKTESCKEISEIRNV